MPALGLSLAVSMPTDAAAGGGIPANVQLDEDGNPIRDEDGNYIYTDS